MILLFRVVEVHRTCEATATPFYGRCQPERVSRSGRYGLWFRAI